jgi:hypothetical protein
MCLSRKGPLPGILSGTLLIFIIISGCKNYGESSHEIPVKGAIYSVHRSDRSHKTYIDVVISRKFTGRVPDDIDFGGVLSWVSS